MLSATIRAAVARSLEEARQVWVWGDNFGLHDGLAYQPATDRKLIAIIIGRTIVRTDKGEAG